MVLEEGTTQETAPEVGSEVSSETTEQTEQKQYMIDGKPVQTWDAFYGKYKNAVEQNKAYAELGDANQLKQDMAQYREWKKTVDAMRTQSSMKPEEKQILDELYRLVPGLKNLEKLPQLEGSLNDYQMRASQSEAQANGKEASIKFSEILRADKIDLKNQNDIERAVFHFMDKEGQEKLAAGDPSEAFKTYKELNAKGFFTGMSVKNVPQIPVKRHTPGGTPPKGQQPKPKSFDEATNEAFETFRQDSA